MNSGFKTLAVVSQLAGIGSFVIAAWQMLPDSHTGKVIATNCVRVILICGASLIAIRILRRSLMKH